MKYKVVVPGVGPTPCDLMIVGEAGGRSEVDQGEPFVGRSGLLLDDALHKAGTHRSCVYITNLYKGDVGNGNRNPTEEEIEDHWLVLRDEFYEVKPDRILTLGKVATSYFMPTGRMSDIVGKSFRNFGPVYDGVEPIWFPCYHPAYVLRGRRVDIVNSFYSVVDAFVRGIT